MSKKFNKNATFITGATGFIAFELLKNILENEPSGHLYLLIRASKGQTAACRFTNVLNELKGINGLKNTINFTDRIHFIEGDITLEKFGMKLSDYTDLARNINRIYHVAASVHLTGDLDTMLKTNVKGTQTVLDFALQAQSYKELDLVNYVSTAYVAGKRRGIIGEDELIKNQKFNNNYERAKYEAELLVQSHRKKLPVAIYRPSIVMGHSQTGWTKTFNVLYEPMKMLYFGTLKFAPAGYKTIVDIVPVDYVAQGIYYISTQRVKAISKTFHLSIGKGRSRSFPLVIKQICGSLFKWADYYKVKNPKQTPVLLKPIVFKYLAKSLYVFSNARIKRKILKMLTYTDYVAITKEFDASNAEKILKPIGIVCPTVEEYMDQLCRYAVNVHFGKSNKPQNVYSKGSNQNIANRDYVLEPHYKGFKYNKD